MFLTVYNFIYNWLFGDGLPSFLAVNVSEWISFGVSCGVILLGIIAISLPLILIIKRCFDW